jgi:hypothetical protein
MSRKRPVSSIGTHRDMQLCCNASHLPVTLRHLVRCRKGARSPRHPAGPGRHPLRCPRPPPQVFFAHLSIVGATPLGLFCTHEDGGEDPLRSSASPSQVYGVTLADLPRPPRRWVAPSSQVFRRRIAPFGTPLRDFVGDLAIRSGASGRGQDARPSVAGADRGPHRWHASPPREGWIFNDHLVEELAGMTAKR